MLNNFLINTKIDFMKYHKVFIFLSFVLLLGSILLVSIRGLNLGIDFSGGILIEARLQEKVEISKIRSLLENKEFGTADIQNFDQKDIMIRISKGEDQDKTIKSIQTILSENFPGIEYRKIDFVGPQIGKELIEKGFLAITLSLISIAVYIWIRFDWQFGIGAIIATIHDAVISFGFFAITGLEFNLTSIAAILTIIGYSVNDTVVIYDRIRENLIKFKKVDLSEIINSSLNSTLSRTILTSSTTLISLVALVLFGGEVLRSFSLSVFFGIIIGTFSSIFIASPILLYFDLRKNKIVEN